MKNARVKTALAAVALSAAALVALPASAYADESIAELSAAYSAAVVGYEQMLDEQGQNASEIASLELEIQATEQAIERSQESLGETARSVYRDYKRPTALVDLLLDSSSFQDAMMRYDTYERVERYYAEQLSRLADEHNQLSSQRAKLEEKKRELEAKVLEAKQAADDAHAALLDATHTDGATFHQRQGNGVNCGATSFTVAVNTLLHENRFKDNVEVWKAPGFNGDSTTDLVNKGQIWLVANGLADEIGIEYYPGDIHQASEMREELEQGHVIVISSGESSIWQRADGTETEPGAFPDGHYIMFYLYDDGIYYSNDSSVAADKGAGAPYTEEQMQQWLDGRSNHFAVVLYKK